MKIGKKLLSSLLSVMLLLSSVGCGQAKQYNAGSYTGTSAGFGGSVSVTITTTESKITDVMIAAEGETADIGGAAVESLESAILKSQSADIDAVSGATVTSNAVKEAANKAIAKAKGEVLAVELTPGTYSSTKEGHQGKTVTVSVTVDESSIIDVQITDITDNPKTITAAPCEQIPAEIVASQSYNVDVVTGATFTSNAIKNAVKDCLDQAGGSDAFSTAPDKADLVEGDDVHTDILVVGGGGAGMMAAIEANSGDTANDDNDLDVILIEKAGFLGGTTSVSGGSRYTYSDETGAYDEAWIETVVEKEKAALSSFMSLEINEDLVRGQAGVIQRSSQLLKEAGVASAFVWGYETFQPCDDHQEPRWSGAYLAYAINKYMPESGIDLRLNTRAMKLLTDETGSVIGVNVQDKESTYNIYAGKVILACGDFAHNQEMIEEFAPEFVNGTPFSAGTNTGDGLRMAMEVGAVPVGNTMMGTLGVDIINDYAPVFLNYGAGRAMFINTNGERFCQETLSGYVAYHHVLRQPESKGWGVVDSNNPKVDALINSNTPEYIHKADTLEELAEILGVPADNLIATVNEYNGYVAAGEDKEFGVAAADLRAVETGPYYAFDLIPLTLTSLVGVEVDGNCHVLREDGSIIPNLFAAGNMVLGGNLVTYYVSGHGIGTALYTGNLAAQTAKAELADK